MSSIASVGRIVHYVSYGTPGGEFGSECRAAIVTSVEPESVEHKVGLCVINPSGVFFNEAVPWSNSGEGGTWHWPEHVA